MGIYTRPPFFSRGNSLPTSEGLSDNIQIERLGVEDIMTVGNQSFEGAEVNKSDEQDVNALLTETVPKEIELNLAQESFVLNSTVSIKFGILGLGQAGGKIADAFAACRLHGKDLSTYPAIAVNTCLADLHALKNIPESQRVPLPNYRLGAMRQPELGYAAISQPGIMEDILSRVERVFSAVDHIIVAAGIGGGTGTGTLQAVCEALSEKGYSVSAMIALPRNIDSVEEKKNAVDFLGVFQELMYSGLVTSAIPVDNNLLYGRYMNMAQESGVDLDWKVISNEEIVRIINEMNATTGLPSPTTFDGAELTKIISSGGCVTFGKKQISLPDPSVNESIALAINYILNSGYLAEYSNLSEARYAGVQVIMPPEMEFGPMIEKAILDQLRYKMPTLLGTYVGHAQVKGQKDLLIYTIVSGMGLPGRAQDLAKLLQSEVDRINEAETKRSQFTATEINLQNPFQKGIRQRNASNPFAKNSPLKSKNPFSKD